VSSRLELEWIGRVLGPLDLLGRPCFDDGVAETFFATLKKELVHRRSWPKKAELRSEVFDYSEVFYNRERRHSTLGQRSPAEYERIHLGVTHAQPKPPPSTEPGELHAFRWCMLASTPSKA
jgi:hypothetical protein